MSVVADKKSGALTGRWRVELQRGLQRYRRRHDSFKEATADEDRVRSLWASGEAIAPSPAPNAPPAAYTLLTARTEAEGALWDGQAQEACNWSRIERMATILGPSVTLDQIDTLAVDRIVRKLKAEGSANGTINGYLSHLRMLLSWCQKRKMTTANIKEIEFSWAKVTQGRIRWITPEEEITLMTLLPENVGHLVKVAIETGCRRDELLTVVPEQINGDRLHLWKTKTDSPRTVYMEPATTALLTGLILSNRLPTHNYLRNAWNRAKDAMGLTDDRDFVFHCCRHTRATRLVEAGIDIRVVKEMLGHKRIETTMRYAHVKASNIEAAMEKVGGYERLMAEKALISATPTVPHPDPLGGVMVEKSEWEQFQEWRKSAVLVASGGV